MTAADEAKEERRSTPPAEPVTADDASHAVEASDAGSTAAGAGANRPSTRPAAAQDSAPDPAPRASDRPRSASSPAGNAASPAADPPADAPAAAASARDPRDQELETLRKERTDLSERLLRTAADFDNFRKRSRREIDEAKLRGKDDALRDLLPVFDNLERAVQASGAAGESVAAVVEGVRMVLKLFEDTTQRMGLNRVPTVGERFDPTVHEAIQQQESSEHTPGTIVAEVAPGYLFGKRLLRAAMVIVARKPAEARPVDPTPATDPSVASGASSGGNGAAPGDAPGKDAASTGKAAP